MRWGNVGTGKKVAAEAPKGRMVNLDQVATAVPWDTVSQLIDRNPVTWRKPLWGTNLNTALTGEVIFAMALENMCTLQVRTRPK